MSITTFKYMSYFYINHFWWFIMFLLDILPRRYTTLFKLKSLTSKLQRAASSIALIGQSLFHGVIPTFAKVKGSF